jgi:zinc-binding in reverse transcriptase
LPTDLVLDQITGKCFVFLSIKMLLHIALHIIIKLSFWKEVNKELQIFNTSVDKQLGNEKNIYFWKDRWLTNNALQSQFPLLFDIATYQNITVSQVIGYNRFYLNFTRGFNTTLRDQLHNLYSQLENISLDDNEDSIIWRWSVTEVFTTTHSCYTWLEFGGINNSQFSFTWSAYIPLKIKNFLWLVQKNKILTKDNLRKKRWQGEDKCIFYNAVETVDHLFLKCSISVCLWNWITSYNNFTFNYNIVQELWQLEASIPYKDSKL